VALERMKSLSWRFQSNRNLLQQYNDILQSKLEQGIVEKVLEADVDNNFTKHYLPHHLMVKPSRNTTYNLQLLCQVQKECEVPQ